MSKLPAFENKFSALRSKRELTVRDLRGIVYCCILYTAVYLYTVVYLVYSRYTTVYSWEDAVRCVCAVYLVYRLYTCILGYRYT